MNEQDKRFSGKNVAKNSFWSVLERICAQAVSFVISIILARLLMPTDYGIVALVQVFISICSLLVERGLTSALSQKKYPDKYDYYSVLNFGFFSSIFLYAILYFLAPHIGQLYSKYNAERLTIQSGGTLNGLFVRSKLIDFVNIVIAPILIGGKDVATLVDGESIKDENELKKLMPLQLIECNKLNDSYVQLKYKVLK